MLGRDYSGAFLPPAGRVDRRCAYAIAPMPYGAECWGQPLIFATEIRLISSDGKQVGVIDTKKALAMAEEEDLDLVEIVPNEKPPVCRIMDYGKFKFTQSKKVGRCVTTLITVVSACLREYVTVLANPAPS